MTEAINNYMTGIEGIEAAIRKEKSRVRRKLLLHEQLHLLISLKKDLGKL